MLPWCAVGGEPHYFSLPGFGPLAVGWGWLILEMFTGAAITLLALSLTGRLRKGIPIAALARIAASTGEDPAQNPQDVLNYLDVGGRPALQEMAAMTGMSEADFLQRAFGIQGVGSQQPNAIHQRSTIAQPPQPPTLPRRIPGTNMFIL